MIYVQKIHFSIIIPQNVICIKIQINPNGFYSMKKLFVNSHFQGKFHSAFWAALGRMLQQCSGQLLLVHKSIALNPTATGDK